MDNRLTKEQFQETVNILLQQRDNFQALFMSVCELNYAITNNPELADSRTITALDKTLNSNSHVKQSKSFFLFRETAAAVVSIIRFSPYTETTGRCISLLKQCIIKSDGNRLRAVAEAASSLPLKISPKLPTSYGTSVIPSVSFNNLLRKQKIQNSCNHRWLGRSLVTEIDDNKLLIIKMAKQNDNLSELNMENEFMSYLSSNFTTKLKFIVPKPIPSSGHFLFRIEELPLLIPQKMDIHKQNICIGFVSSKDYFIYPNEPNDAVTIDEEKFQEIIIRGSSLFGQLAGQGLIHTAPVPLFHNRVQQDRRDDGGIYDWSKGGRLDQWLESCRFPNFGESGIRDFEHFQLYDGNSLKLYKHIGSHILSLILVTGSFYRNIGKDNSDKQLIGRSGLDKHGKVINARELFNEKLLPTIIESLIQNYHKNFTRKKKFFGFPFDFNTFSKCLLDEMGVDKHMEEVLRIPDQKKMSEKEFTAFLLDKGFEKADIDRFTKGEKEIITPTGPHLGGFNQKISIPLLPELLAKTSSFCIIDKFKEEQEQA